MSRTRYQSSLDVAEGEGKSKYTLLHTVSALRCAQRQLPGAADKADETGQLPGVILRGIQEILRRKATGLSLSQLSRPGCSQSLLGVLAMHGRCR